MEKVETKPIIALIEGKCHLSGSQIKELKRNIYIYRTFSIEQHL